MSSLMFIKHNKCVAFSLKPLRYSISYFSTSTKLKGDVPVTADVDYSTKPPKKSKSSSPKKESLVKVSLTKKDATPITTTTNIEPSNPSTDINTFLNILSFENKTLTDLNEVNSPSLTKSSLEEFNAAFGITRSLQSDQIPTEQKQQKYIKDPDNETDIILSSSFNAATIDPTSEWKDSIKNMTPISKVPKTIAKIFPVSKNANQQSTNINSIKTILNQPSLLLESNINNPKLSDSKNLSSGVISRNLPQVSQMKSSMTTHEQTSIKVKEQLHSKPVSSFSNSASISGFLKEPIDVDCSPLVRNNSILAGSLVPKDIVNFNQEHPTSQEFPFIDMNLPEESSAITDMISLDGDSLTVANSSFNKCNTSVENLMPEESSLDLHQKENHIPKYKSVPISINTSPIADINIRPEIQRYLDTRSLTKTFPPTFQNQFDFSNNKPKSHVNFHASFDQLELKILKSISFTFPPNPAPVVDLLLLYDQYLDQTSSRTMKISIFLKSLRLFFYLCRPTIFTPSTIFNISKLKAIADASIYVPDISLIFPLEKMLPTSKFLQDSRVNIPVEVHNSILSILEKVRAKLFAYEYYLEFIMRDVQLSSNSFLLKNVIKALSGHQFASRSVFEHFIRNGGTPSPNLVIELLSIPYLIDSSYLYEPYFDQFIRMPYLEQKLTNRNDIFKVDNNHLLLASQSMLRMYAYAHITNPSFFQRKIDSLKMWIGTYAPSVGARPEFNATCKDLIKEKYNADISVTLD